MLLFDRLLFLALKWFKKLSFFKKMANAPKKEEEEEEEATIVSRKRLWF